MYIYIHTILDTYVKSCFERNPTRQVTVESYTQVFRTQSNIYDGAFLQK